MLSRADGDRATPLLQSAALSSDEPGLSPVYDAVVVPEGEDDGQCGAVAVAVPGGEEGPGAADDAGASSAGGSPPKTIECYVCLEEGATRVCQCTTGLHEECQRQLVERGSVQCSVCKTDFTNLRTSTKAFSCRQCSFNALCVCWLVALFMWARIMFMDEPPFMLFAPTFVVLAVSSTVLIHLRRRRGFKFTTCCVPRYEVVFRTSSSRRGGRVGGRV
jgi:hypothetical protein